MVKALFKLVAAIILIIGIFQLFSGHADHIKRLQMGLNKPVTYHQKPTKYLYCNDWLIGSGDIYYEDKIQTNRSASNSNGIWRINGAVYKQAEGSICEVRE